MLYPTAKLHVFRIHRKNKREQKENLFINSRAEMLYFVERRAQSLTMFVGGKLHQTSVLIIRL